MAEEAFSINLLSKATEALLSPPFGWCYVKGGPVTLEDASQYGGSIGDAGWDYAWGNNLEDSFANFGNNIGQPTPVGTYLKNRSPYHVVDMVGNVWEWCLTSWGAQEDEVGGYTYRVIRGGPGM